MLANNFSSLLRAMVAIMASSSASIQAFGDDTYLIMPIEKIDVKASHELQSRIEQLARGPQWVYASKSPNEPVPAYWGAQLSPSAFRQLKGDKLVCSSNVLASFHI